MFLLSLNHLFAQETSFNIEQLNYMKEEGLLSEQDYKVLYQELTGEIGDGKNLYNLKINSKLVSRDYMVLIRGGKSYFPVKKFFEIIGFTNYKEENGKVVAYLGSSLKEIKIDLTQGSVRDGNEIFLEKEIFKKNFLLGYDIDRKRLDLDIFLSFDTPKEIQQLLDISQAKLEQKENKNELLFGGKRKLFDLGYTRIQLGENFIKNEGEKSYSADWDGSLSYQGGLLYGEIIADYDIRENELGTMRLRYGDLWKNHTLNIENRNNSSRREWGLEFYKDRSFFENSGGEIVITESVPVGSRVELIYMGTPVDI